MKRTSRRSVSSPRASRCASSAVLACVGCWSGARSSAPGPGASTGTPRVDDGRVVVRMAGEGEFSGKPPPARTPDGRRLAILILDCNKTGPLKRAYVKPLVAFVHEHLLDDNHGEVHERVVTGAGEPEHELGDGVNIIVEPRSAVGELRVVWVGPPFDAPGERWAETRYCLHVLRRGTSTTIVLKRTSSLIK